MIGQIIFYVFKNLFGVRVLFFCNCICFNVIQGQHTEVYVKCAFDKVAFCKKEHEDMPGKGQEFCVAVSSVDVVTPVG